MFGKGFRFKNWIYAESRYCLQTTEYSRKSGSGASCPSIPKIFQLTRHCFQKIRIHVLDHKPPKKLTSFPESKPRVEGCKPSDVLKESDTPCRQWVFWVLEYPSRQFQTTRLFPQKIVGFELTYTILNMKYLELFSGVVAAGSIHRSWMVMHRPHKIPKALAQQGSCWIFRDNPPPIFGFKSYSLCDFVKKSSC